MSNLVIVGSREYSHLQLVRDYVKQLSPDICVVSGGARGVDTVAEQAARECGLEVRIFPADWGRYGKSAGMKRNVEMVLAADRLVAFWDEKSKGTLNSIQQAEEKGIPVTVYYADGKHQHYPGYRQRKLFR